MTHGAASRRTRIRSIFVGIRPGRPTLEHLGRRLGAREGTGPDDDPFLRSFRAESREEGRAAGLTEGRAKTIRQILRSRGIEVSAGFPADAPGFAESPEGEAVAAALACDSERDFHVRIRKP